MADTIDEPRPLKGYNTAGLASVLDAASDKVTRASHLLFKFTGFGKAPVVSAASRREADVCLTEAEELIAAVRREIFQP